MYLAEDEDVFRGFRRAQVIVDPIVGRMNGERRGGSPRQPVDRVLSRNVFDVVAEIVKERGDESSRWFRRFFGSGNLLPCAFLRHQGR